MKHAILGAGAIGGLVGTALASLGEDVTVVVRPERLPSFPGNLLLERPSGSGSITAPAKAVATLTEPVDVLWIATKTYQLQTALDVVRVVPGCVVPLLNGVDHIAVLAARFGPERVVPATIAVEAERIAPGRFIQRSPFVRLNVAGRGEPLLGVIVAGLGDLGFNCQFIQNEQTLLWSKLCFLGPFALVTSASGLNVGEIFADARWKQRLSSAIAEACAVANASGAEVDALQLQAAGHAQFHAKRPCRRPAARIGCYWRSYCARRRAVRDRCLDDGRVDGDDSLEDGRPMIAAIP